jgi:hypothetical protein
MKKFCVGGNSENVSPFFFLAYRFQPKAADRRVVVAGILVADAGVWVVEAEEGIAAPPSHTAIHDVVAADPATHGEAALSEAPTCIEVASVKGVPSKGEGLPTHVVAA